MEIQTERLTIRYIKESDWEGLQEIWADFSRSPYAQYDVPHTLDTESIKQKAKQWAEVSPDMEHIFFAVCLNDRMIGCADFHHDGTTYECGYSFHSSMHGKGYAKESITAILHFLSEYGSTGFTAGTALNNTPSVRLLYSLGFQKIGEESVSFYKDEAGTPIYFDGGVFACEVR